MADIITDTINGLKDTVPDCRPFVFDLAWKFCQALSANRSKAPVGDASTRRDLLQNAAKGYVDGYRYARDGFYDENDLSVPENITSSPFWPRLEASCPSASRWEFAQAARFIDYVSDGKVGNSDEYDYDAVFYAGYGFVNGLKKGMDDNENGAPPYQPPELIRRIRIAKIASMAMSNTLEEYAEELYLLCGEPETEAEMAYSDAVTNTFMDILLDSAIDCLECWFPTSEILDESGDDNTYAFAVTYMDHFCSGFFDVLCDIVDSKDELADDGELYAEYISTGVVPTCIEGVCKEFPPSDEEIAQTHACLTWVFEMDAKEMEAPDFGYLAMAGVAYSAGNTAAVYAQSVDAPILELSHLDENSPDQILQMKLDSTRGGEYRCEYSESEDGRIDIPEELLEDGVYTASVEVLDVASAETDLVASFKHLLAAFGDIGEALQVLDDESFDEMPTMESLSRFHEAIGAALSEDPGMREVVLDHFGEWPRILRLAEQAAKGEEPDRRIYVLRPDYD